MPELTGDELICIVAIVAGAAVIIVGILKGYDF